MWCSALDDLDVVYADVVLDSYVVRITQKSKFQNIVAKMYQNCVCNPLAVHANSSFHE